jgi:uncharacterized protein (DUF1800 family)
VASTTGISLKSNPISVLVDALEHADVMAEPSEAPFHLPSPLPLVTTLTSSLALAACGGSSGSPTAANPPSLRPPAATPTAVEAARFLAQASFGGTATDIEEVRNLGFESWLDRQFQIPRSQSHFDWMIENGYGASNFRFTNFGLDGTLWRKLMSSPDVLRQRVTLALTEIFVVSSEITGISWRGMTTANFVDRLETHAFGNFRTLLEEVTLSVAMGDYLNMKGNQRADSSGRVPDENYAREVMQLFTIGVTQLNPNGTPRMINGVEQDAYTGDDIMGLARVFTGWDYDGHNPNAPDHAARRMSFLASRHSPEEKSFLGVTIPAGTSGPASLSIALDTLANHPNVGPFVGKQLIQRLVTSNPSPAYVNRVALVFANNGSNVRGDLGATVRAVLLDAEAREANTSPNWGKLREPMIRMIQWARTFSATSPTGIWDISNTSDVSTRLGQSPLRSPSVFNFFRPGYVPANTSIAREGLVGPEFQITNESSVVGYVNWMRGVIDSGRGEVQANYAPWLPLSNNAGELFDQLNLLLAANQLGSTSRHTVVSAVNTMAVATETNRLNRVKAIVWLIMCSPEYIVQK